MARTRPEGWLTLKEFATKYALDLAHVTRHRAWLGSKTVHGVRYVEDRPLVRPHYREEVPEGWLTVAEYCATYKIAQSIVAVSYDKLGAKQFNGAWYIPPVPHPTWKKRQRVRLPLVIDPGPDMLTMRAYAKHVGKSYTTVMRWICDKELAGCVRCSRDRCIYVPKTAERNPKRANG